MSKTAQIALVGAAAIALSGVAHAANLVADGDFNMPYAGPGFATYGAGSSFGPWSVTSGSVDLIGGYWQSPSGPSGGSVDLDGNSPGAISQSIATMAGHYTLSFDLSGNPDGGAASKTVQVTVGSGSQSYTYTIGANTHADMMYAPETLSFNATGPTTLTFTSLDSSGAYGPVIGNVSVTGVPEPTTWAVMLLGFAGVGSVVRRRRAATAA